MEARSESFRQQSGSYPPLPQEAYEGILRDAYGPQCSGANVQQNWPKIMHALEEQHIADRDTVIAAVATLAVEESDLKPVDENGTAADFKRKYQGKHGLGNDRPGDGAKYHGRGFVQLTGKVNYHHYGKELGLDLENHPELALDPDNAARIFAAYFKDHDVAEHARQGAWKKVRSLVNGGLSKFPKFIKIVRELAGTHSDHTEH